MNAGTSDDRGEFDDLVFPGDIVANRSTEFALVCVQDRWHVFIAHRNHLRLSSIAVPARGPGRTCNSLIRATISHFRRSTLTASIRASNFATSASTLAISVLVARLASNKGDMLLGKGFRLPFGEAAFVRRLTKR